MKKFYFKYFLFEALTNGFGFASIMSIFHYLEHNTFNFAGFIFYFFSFGITMGVVNFFILKAKLEKIQLKQTDEEYLKSRHTVKLEEKISTDSIIQKLQNDHRFNRYKIIQKEPDHLRLISKSQFIKASDPLIIQNIPSGESIILKLDTERYQPIYDRKVLRNLEKIKELRDIIIS